MALHATVVEIQGAHVGGEEKKPTTDRRIDYFVETRLSVHSLSKFM